MSLVHFIFFLPQKFIEHIYFFFGVALVKLYYMFDDFKMYKLLTTIFVMISLQLMGRSDLSWTG